MKIAIRKGVRQVPLSQFEQQLYATLIEIKQTNATICANIRAVKESYLDIKRELDKLEDMSNENKHDIIKLKSGAKAWVSAAAAIGGVVGWLLSVLKEALTQ